MLDVSKLSVAIILGTDSSKIKAQQRLGRVCRREDGKQAEIFYIVLNNTKETDWVATSHKGSSYITIDEKGLDDVLQYKTPEPYKKQVKKFVFRF